MNSVPLSFPTLFLKAFTTALLVIFATFPAIAQELKSGGTGNPVAVDFVNGTNGKLGIYWIDFNGGEQYYGNIEPGAFYRQPTGAGHVWRAKAGETEVGIYTATEAPEQRHTFEISSEAAAPAEGSPPKDMPATTGETPPAGPAPNSMPPGDSPFLPKGIPNKGQPRAGEPPAVPQTDSPQSPDQPKEAMPESPSPKAEGEPTIGGQDKQQNFRQNPALNQQINLQQPDLASIHEAISLVTNETRIKNGVAPLEISPQLTAAAKMHATDMVNDGFFDHQNMGTESKRSPDQRAAMHGIANPSIAENIAQNFAVQYVAGTPISSNTVIPPHTPLTLADALVAQWMNSPAHRQNILSDQAKAIGCGVQVRPAQPFPGIYAVQKFQLFNNIELSKEQ